MACSIFNPTDYADQDLMVLLLPPAGRFVNKDEEEFMPLYVPQGKPLRVQDCAIAFANEVKEGRTLQTQISYCGLGLRRAAMVK